MFTMEVHLLGVAFRWCFAMFGDIRKPVPLAGQLLSLGETIGDRRYRLKSVIASANRLLSNCI